MMPFLLRVSRWFVIALLVLGFSVVVANAADKPVPPSPPAQPPLTLADKTLEKLVVKADDKASVAEPDSSTNPVLAAIKKTGANVYYMGTRGGLDGWLVVKGSQLQIAYAITGSQNLMIGALFGPSGENISSAQLQSIFDEHPELKNLFVNAAQATAAATSASTTPGTLSPSAMGLNGGNPAADAQTKIFAGASGMQMPSGTMLPAVQTYTSPGEHLYHDLLQARGVDLGSPNTPELLMVMDPTCPHCKATWKMLRDKVFSNALHVHLVVISRDADDKEESRVAAQLMQVTNPAEAWDKYVNGDKDQLAGTPDPALIQAVKANHDVVDGWRIRSTPFLVYRGRDGKVKIVEGEPMEASALFSDLLP
jgi:protein-disulfide isomerase